MILNLEIPDEVFSAIERGEDRDLKDILLFKVGTLYKRHRPRRPFPGRPPFSLELKRAKELERELRGVFENLRQTFPDDFESLYGQLEQQFKEAASSGDSEMLESLASKKPWLHSQNLLSKSSI